jgi:hypothetical protein
MILTTHSSQIYTLTLHVNFTRPTPQMNFTHRFEYMHIPERERCNWLRQRIETPEEVVLSRERKIHTLDRLAWSEMFETFCANK